MENKGTKGEREDKGNHNQGKDTICAVSSFSSKSPSDAGRCSDSNSFVLEPETGEEEDPSWKSVFNWDDFGYCVISGFASVYNYMASHTFYPNIPIFLHR